MASSKSSLRHRLPIWIALLLAVAVITFGTLAYVAARRESEHVMWVRLRAVADRFTQLSGAGMRTRVGQHETIARDPAVVAFLKGGSDSMAVRTILTPLGPDTGITIAVGLRSAGGTPVLSLRRPVSASPIPASPDSARVGEMYQLDGAPAYDITAPVLDGERVIGHVVSVRGLVSTPTTLRLLNELVGPGGTLLLGNADGSEWTDFARPLGRLPIGVGNGTFADGPRKRMVYSAAVPNTPFLLGVSVPRAQALAPVAGLLWTLIGIGVLVVGGGGLVGWLVIRRITTPLVQLTEAAESIAAGTQTGEWHIVGGDDEVGRLGDAFAVMSRSVTAARERLEQQVLERTAQLQQAQEELIQREKMAVLGQLASSVGHELRNPLGVMANATYYLTATLKDAPPKTSQHLAILRRQIGIAEKIVTDILDFTKVREPQRAPVDVAEFIDDQLQRVSIPSDVHVTREVATPVAQVLADPFQVGQVLFNVLTNAIQAMEPAGGALGVRAHGDNGSVCIDISDEGSGIAEECRERVFEPLYTTKLRGIGLGLSVSRTLARANGGDLTIVASGAGGTTFRLELPTWRDG